MCRIELEAEGVIYPSVGRKSKRASVARRSVVAAREFRRISQHFYRFQRIIYYNAEPPSKQRHGAQNNVSLTGKHPAFFRLAGEHALHQVAERFL